MKRILAVVGAGLLILLTGCTNMNSAATVGNTQIPITAIQKSIDAVLAERAKVDTTSMTLETGATLATSELRFHLISQLLVDVSTEHGIKLTVAEQATRKKAIIAQVGGAAALPQALVGAGIASTDFDMYIQSVLYSEKLTQLAITQGATTANSGAAIQAMVVKTAKRLKVTVNPRYGKWDPVAANVVSASTTNGAVSAAQ